jgi:hypothetical protein
LIDQPPQQSAHLAAIHAEVTGHTGRRGGAALADLVHQPGFGQTIGALVHALFEQADDLGVETVEAADFGDLRGWVGHDDVSCQSLTWSII